MTNTTSIAGWRDFVCCAMRDHVVKFFKNCGKSIRVMPIVKRLESISKHLTYGRQEDAHKFLVCALDAMQKKSSLYGIDDLDVLCKETTVIDQIFGAYIKNRLCCELLKYDLLSGLILISYIFGNELWIIMEYVRGKTLRYIILRQRLTQEEIAVVCHGVLSALQYLFIPQWNHTFPC